MTAEVADAPTLSEHAQTRSKRPSGYAAGLLSFVWPGMGHAYLRRARRALFLAIPPALLLLGTAVAILANPGAAALTLLAPSAVTVVLIAIAVDAVWRVAAIADSVRSTRRLEGGRVVGPLVLAGLLSLAIVGVHLAAGAYVQSFSSAGALIFAGARPSGPDQVDQILGGSVSSTPLPIGSGVPGDTNGDGVVNGLDIIPGDTNGDGVVDSNDDPQTDSDGESSVGAGPPPSTLPFYPSVTPPPFDANGVPTGQLPSSGPINVLFIGLDSGDGRNHSLSDSLIVASYYPERDTLTMISFPRDTGELPLYKGSTYPNRINTFLDYAGGNTALFPEGPISALMNELGYLLGSPIEFYAATNLDGLPQAVDAVGGIDVTLDKAIDDTSMPLYMQPGDYHLDGEQALAYARSRHGPNNSDFIRARRQQQVLSALAQRLKDPTVSLNLPSIINDLSAIVRTNVPRDQVGLLLTLIQRASTASTENIVLSPPGGYAGVIPAAEVNGRYMTQLDISAVADLSKRIFGTYSSYQ